MEQDQQPNNNNIFEIGQLIVPNDILEAAFYHRHSDVFYDEVIYRVATSSEFIYYCKYIESNVEVQKNINSYIRKNNKVASEHSKARDKELDYFRERSSNGRKHV
jgi:hypothetical protein